MRKIAILGRAPTWELAPFSDPAWEIWGLPWQEMPRADRLFEIHSQEYIDGANVPENQADETWIHWARESYPDVPVYCDPSRKHLFGKNAVDYPLEQVTAFLPFMSLESSISYMIANALCEGVDVLGLYGIHMMGGAEFAHQRPSVHYLVGLAQGRGVEVVIPPGSPLFMSGYVAGRYGLPGGERLANFVNMAFGPRGTEGYLMEKPQSPDGRWQKENTP